MFQSEQLQEKWAPLLEYDGLDSIKDPHRKAVTAVLLENQEKFLKETSSFENGGSLLNEAAPTNSTGSSIDNFDPVLISLIRRSMPNLIAYDLAGVQPMSGPTGLIFAMRSRYQNQSGTEAFYTSLILHSPDRTSDATWKVASPMVLLVWVLLPKALAPTPPS